jgi:aspartyl-tRNA(Asn)/glutamyl-tRNA(Gln) amidotransferase subunit B
MTWKTDIGLEVHVQLRTQSKMFCGCANASGGEPNTQVCPVCLGYPGALPVVNEEAVKLTVRTGLLLGCDIQPFSKFDRKNYFYPDQAKNYQISQYDQPLCLGGGLEIEVGGTRKFIRLTRIHLEEDVAKNTHFDEASGIDFNRGGTPLMEIVTEPDLSTPDETMAFLLALKQVLHYGEVSDCNLEQGNIRCDVNSSVRPEGQAKLGVKVELKNMNTFKGVHRALKSELARQVRELERGGTLVQETRRWNDEAGVTESMRTKEYAHDYRYFPEPDLLPVRLEAATIERWRSELPELPARRRARLVEQFGLPDYDAGVLVADKRVADYFETTAGLCGNAKAASNWIMTEVLRILSEREAELSSLRVTPQALAGLIKLVDQKDINMPSAKLVFGVLCDEGGDPESIVKARGLAQVSDSGAMDGFVEQAISAHPKSVADYRAGKQPAFEFLVGQVMRFSKGKANPQLARELLLKKLG